MILTTDNEIIEKIISKLIQKRKKLGYSQKILAQQSGLSFRTIQTMETGTAPNLKTLIAVLRALGELQLLIPLSTEEMISPKELHQQQFNE